ncbi:MAG: hypothetical protein R3E82_08935 [Pseudomonadales bacterium]|nr:hypothetical protein [Pseudomonadales bacterium]
MGILKITGAILAVLLLCVVGILVSARYADGPWEMIAGGPFTSGKPYRGPEPDWAFVRDIVTVEFQLMDPPRSRTTWILEHEGRIYIPCGYMDTAWGRFWKQWPIEAEKDGQAILRVNGTLYDRRLVRVTSGPEIAPLTAQIVEKYKVPATPAAVEANSLWLFELAPAG